MPKMSSGNAPSTRAVVPAREINVSPASKRSIDASTGQADDPTRRHKKVKVLTRRHKSRHNEGESRSHSKDKKPAAPSEELDTPIALFDRVHDAGQLITFMDYQISQLQQELDTLKSSGGPETVAKAKEGASELGQELEKTKRE
ncbi:hypothetical protein B296_00020917 [Ensete ventricosum]|uniref:Uncharacterized protein n=1 Tax=Ensete ventricosum TaxID=4639 RepID=A0A426XYG4_ENSVE|nr:hypothetical protein B296_00020917 [Ensete ventricosum]